jgi:hypothetical protein
MIRTIICCVCVCLLLTNCGGSDDEPFKPREAPTGLTLAERWEVVNASMDSVMEGDLITRCGNDYMSYTLRDFSQTDPMYSHTGLALRGEDGILYVYHNMGERLNPDEPMRRERVDSFLTPVNNIAYGVYRYDFNAEELANLKTIVVGHHKNGLRFDMNFDLETEDKMYCSEMIAKSIIKATNGRITFKTNVMNNELKRKYLKMALREKALPSREAGDVRQYYGIDNLYLVPQCKQVMKHIFALNTGPMIIPSPEIDSN